MSNNSQDQRGGSCNLFLSWKLIIFLNMPNLLRAKIKSNRTTFTPILIYVRNQKIQMTDTFLVFKAPMIHLKRQKTKNIEIKCYNTKQYLIQKHMRNHGQPTYLKIYLFLRKRAHGEDRQRHRKRQSQADSMLSS